MGRSHAEIEWKDAVCWVLALFSPFSCSEARANKKKERSNRHGNIDAMPTKDQIQLLTVPHLKDLCTLVGLPTGGKRADLRARLQGKIDEIQAADAVAPPADSQAAEGVS